MSAPVFFQFAIPTDDDVDAFDSGVDEVTKFFRTREWFKDDKMSPPTYEFRTVEGGPCLGYAAVSFRSVEHPTNASGQKGKYLTIWAAGLNKQFLGVENPLAPGENYSVSVFNVIEQLARDKKGCVGLSLWVRENNPRAIAFYKRFGFVEDPEGPIQRFSGAKHLTMRKIF